MRSFAALLLAFSASALAYKVTSPSESQGWTNSGAQTLTWERVSSDPLNFTAVLTNENRSVMPNNNQVLAALIDGSKLSTTVNPPSAGWPTGDKFRVNLVQDASSLTTILAQSSEFSIKASTNSSTTSKPSGPTVVAPTATGATPSATEATEPTVTPNTALPAFNAQTGLMGALALLGVFLA